VNGASYGHEFVGFMLRDDRTKLNKKRVSALETISKWMRSKRWQSSTIWDFGTTRVLRSMKDDRLRNLVLQKGRLGRNDVPLPANDGIIDKANKPKSEKKVFGKRAVVGESKDGLTEKKWTKRSARGEGRHQANEDHENFGSEVLNSF
jgi:hypothetical protein